MAAGRGRTVSHKDTDRQPPGYTPRCPGTFRRKRALQTLLCLPIRCPDSESECVSFLLPACRKVIYVDPRNYSDRGVERALFEHATLWSTFDYAKRGRRGVTCHLNCAPAGDLMRGGNGTPGGSRS